LLDGFLGVRQCFSMFHSTTLIQRIAPKVERTETPLNPEEQVYPLWCIQTVFSGFDNTAITFTRSGELARTRIYNKPPAGLVPDDSPTQLASQVTGTGRHDGAQVVIDDHLKEVLANWSVIPLSVREAIVAIIRCAIPKDGHDEH